MTDIFFLCVQNSPDHQLWTSVSNLAPYQTFLCRSCCNLIDLPPVKVRNGSWGLMSFLSDHLPTKVSTWAWYNYIIIYINVAKWHIFRLGRKKKRQNSQKKNAKEKKKERERNNYHLWIHQINLWDQNLKCFMVM